MTELALVLVIVALLLAFGFWLLLRADAEPPQPTAAPHPLPAPKRVIVQKTIRQVLPETLTQQLDAIQQQLSKPAPPPAVPPVPPAPVPAPVPPPRVAAPAKAVRVQLVSAKGRKLTPDPIVMDARARKPVYRHRTRDGLVSVFVADHQGSDGVWIYRRVGVEREH